MSLEDKLNELLLRQDEYNASALADIKSDPTKFAQFLNNAQQNILNKTINQHSDLYDKTYNDLQRAADAQKNIYYYYQRNIDVNNMQDSIFKNVTANAPKTAATGSTNAEDCPYIKLFHRLIPILRNGIATAIPSGKF